jgi:hypothetical protein
LLETVAIFVDGWTIEAAADVANLDEDRALDLTEALARHSLIFLDITELGPRPRMLETIRVFVAERLAARPDATEIGRRHADYYRALAERADRFDHAARPWRPALDLPRSGRPGIMSGMPEADPTRRASPTSRSGSRTAALAAACGGPRLLPVLVDLGG